MGGQVWFDFDLGVESELIVDRPLDYLRIRV